MVKKRHRFDKRPEFEVPAKTGMLMLFSFVAASIAVLFMLCVNWLYGQIFPRICALGTLQFAIWSLLSICLGALVVGSMYIEFLETPSPCGIPNLKESYKTLGARFWFKTVFVNFLAGVISLGTGASLGREGPTVYASGASAALCAKLCNNPPSRRRIVCMAGAAAGLAAAFNTPIAAVVFVFEVLTDKINRREMGGLFLAAVIGACTSWVVIGRQPAYIVPELSSVTMADYLLTPIVALFAAAIGIFFQKRALLFRGRVKACRIKPWLRPLVGALLVWIIGICVFIISGRTGIFSIGFQDLSAALAGDLVWYIALLLLVGKVVTTYLAYSWGMCGGIFAPNLFFGAMVGVVVSGVAEELGANVGDHGSLLLALVGMSACLGAVIRAPLTAMLIVFEMTGRYEVVPPLMIAMVVSQAYAYYFSDKISIYNAVLRIDEAGRRQIKK